jgi:hypothetical protein
MTDKQHADTLSLWVEEAAFLGLKPSEVLALQRAIFILQAESEKTQTTQRTRLIAE